MWSIDLRHFLDEKGSTSQLPTPEALRMAEHFGAMVAYVTLHLFGEHMVIDNVSCCSQEAPDCVGDIIGWLEPLDESIRWYCDSCDDGGVIVGWQNTLWDCRELASNEM